MAKVVLLLTIAVLAVAGAFADTSKSKSKPSSMSQCEGDTISACRPWYSFDLTNKACKKGDRMDLRFGLEVASSRWGNNGWYNNSQSELRPYYFCPVVDQLQAFTLVGSANLTALRGTEYSDDPANHRFSYTPNVTNLQVYGMGSKDTTGLPLVDYDATTVIYESNSSACRYDDGSTGPAIVDFLVLNITMLKGKYNYVSGFDQAVKVGFQPTCDETDHCKLFGGGPCVGKKGKKNCAKCLSKVSDAYDKDVKIWASYYGSDSKGRMLRSGSENPLAFRQFSATPIFDKVTKEVGNLEGKL